MRKPYQSPGQDEKLIPLYCPGRVIFFFLRLFRAAAVLNFFKVPDLAGLGYGLGLGFWVVFTIIVSLTLTLTLITTLTIILP